MSARTPLNSDRARLAARRRARLRRRNRTFAVAGTLVVVGAVLAVVTSGGTPVKTAGHPPAATSATSAPAGAASAGRATTRATTTSTAASGVKIPRHAIPAIESGNVPWTLPVPLSREVAIGGTSGQVVLLGGLTSPSTSTAGVARVTVPVAATPSPGAPVGATVPQSTPPGTVVNLATLASPGHDAAGVALGSRYLVFGGGLQATVDTVEAVPAGGAGGATGTVVGSLPQPRSDASAVVIGSRAYVVGGYDGTKADAAVLSTKDGRSFQTVATLPVPVRYAAVAALGRTIYVVGGMAVSGKGAGQPVNAVQRIDVGAGSAQVVSHLSQPLAGASAAVLGGHLYVAGGESTAGGAPSPTIWALDPRTGRLLAAGALQVPEAFGAMAAVGDTGWLVGGEVNGTPMNTVQMLRPNLSFGYAGAAGAGSPYFGSKLLIADRGNNRLLLLSDTRTILWTYPSATRPPPPGPNGFFFPDDSFFVDKGTAIITNQEENETIVKIGYPSGKILWTYGHPAQIGSAPGYLHEPDDAYLLKNGQITVADADNCRILVINPDGSIANQIGTSGVCVHHPPTSMTSPNADTPLADGNLLVSEITGSYVDEYTLSGQLVWSTHVAVGYPSDPQQLGPDLYLMADYSHPGAFVEFNRAGQILYRYQPTSGPGELNQPSLVEKLPSGVFMANDDYRHRIMAVDPVTQALVWQYGVTDHPGTAPGMLNTPDGFDILLPNGTTPTHTATG